MTGLRTWIAALAVLAACASPESEDAQGRKAGDAKAEKAEDPAAETTVSGEEAAVRACFDRFLAGLEGFEKEAVIAELTGDKDEMRSAVFFLDYLVAGHEFEKAFRATHGDAAWGAFNDAEGATVQVSMPIDRSALESASVKVDGEQAEMIFARSGSGPSFRRVEGAWKLQATSVFPHDPSGNQRTGFARMADVLVQARARAEDASVDPEALDAELGEALKQAMAAEPAPAPG